VGVTILRGTKAVRAQLQATRTLEPAVYVACNARLLRRWKQTCRAVQAAFETVHRLSKEIRGLGLRTDPAVRAAVPSWALLTSSTGLYPYRRPHSPHRAATPPIPHLWVEINVPIPLGD
jgi:hypothetical protein